MANPESDDYKFLRIVDAVASINQRVNLIGVVTEAGIPKQSKGTDCCCTIRIIDESNSCSGISINFFAETFEKLPNVELTGDIIQLSRVVMKVHGSEVNAVFNKKFSSFALYKGSNDSTFKPYQASSNFHARDQDKKFISDLRKWTISHQPEPDSSGCLQLKEIKQGIQSNLICKVLHICKTTQNEWNLFLWDGTDAPPLTVHAKLEEELEKPVPLQLQKQPLSRDILCSFPTVGTILRITTDKCTARLSLHLLKIGKWIHFKNIQFESCDGLWCGVLMRSSKFSYLSDDNKLALQFQRQYEKRFKGKWTRMPFTSFPWPSHITETEHEDVPFVTLMDILTYPEVTCKYRCVVRVVVTLPGDATKFRAPNGIYRMRFTLEDPTARIHAYLYNKDAEKFFGGYPGDDEMVKMHRTLLGITEANEMGRNPPWVVCVLKSYYIDKRDVWGSRRYGICDTKLVG